jgi:hypothetical protein
MRHVKIIPGTGEGEVKEKNGRGEFKYDILQELLQMSKLTFSTTIQS